jgi:2'-5' RNA ligase
MIRLFVALIIPVNVKKEIFRNCFTAIHNPSDYRWEADEKIHLTLKFIGEVKEELLSSIVDELEFIKNYSAFSCTISKFGFFFRDNQAKILWCNIEQNDSINTLAEELNKRLQKFGVEAEKRKFKGHLTLLRIKNKVSEDFIRKFLDYKFVPIEFNTNEVALIQSILKPAISEYKVLKIYELK